MKKADLFAFGVRAFTFGWAFVFAIDDLKDANFFGAALCGSVAALYGYLAQKSFKALALYAE